MHFDQVTVNGVNSNIYVKHSEVLKKEIIDSVFFTCYAIVDFERRRCRVTDRVFSKQLFRTTRQG